MFFVQAEDGIRVGHVTGVQTCALPISRPRGRVADAARRPATPGGAATRAGAAHGPARTRAAPRRSEERRVGKEWRLRRALERERVKKEETIASQMETLRHVRQGKESV